VLDDGVVDDEDDEDVDDDEDVGVVVDVDVAELLDEPHAVKARAASAPPTAILVPFRTNECGLFVCIFAPCSRAVTPVVVCWVASTAG